jgi:hypothetical protein
MVPAASGDPATVREIVRRWLERRGFELLPPGDLRAGLFDDELETERTVFLCSSPRWSVIVFGNALDEGDRLLMELVRLPVVLETAVFDSETWVYELHEGGKLTVAFCARPGLYDEYPKLPANGDPERLCTAIGVGQPREVRRVQRRRGTFAERPWRVFCRLIDADAAAFHPDDLRYLNRGRSRIYSLAGWTVEPMFFVKAASTPSSQVGALHNLVPRAPDARPEPPPVLDEETKRLMRTGRLLTLPVRLLSFALTPLLWLWVRGWGRFWPVNELDEAVGPLLRAMVERAGEDAFEGGFIVDRRYGFRLRVERPPPDSNRPFRGLHHIVVDGVGVVVRVVRPEALQSSFPRAYAPLADERFFIGPHPARYLSYPITSERTGSAWYVELPHVIVVFEAESRTGAPLEPTTVDRIRALVSTFEAIDRAPT